MIKDSFSTQSVEAASITAASKTMGGGMFTTVIGYLSSSGAAVLIGVTVTIMGFMLSVYFQHKKDKREEMEWKFKKKLLEEESKRKKERHVASLQEFNRYEDP